MKRQHLRQAALLKLVQRRRLSSQDEMVKLLRKSGFDVTQASVSRDVRELGLVRMNGHYVTTAGIATAESPNGAIPHGSELIISAEPVGANLVVIRTPPGAAGTVAVELDGMGEPEIAGTIAGDDTIFVAVRSRAAQGRVLALLKGAPSAAPRTTPGPRKESKQ